MCSSWLTKWLSLIYIYSLFLLWQLQWVGVNNWLTITRNTSIFTVWTIFGCSIIKTVQKFGLIANTVNIIKLDWSSTLTKLCICEGNNSCRVQMYSCYAFSELFTSATHIYCLCLSPVVGYPSCLQTTWASTVPQLSSQTVPQTEFRHISTLPSVLFDPPTSLTAPVVLHDAAPGMSFQEVIWSTHW